MGFATLSSPQSSSVALPPTSGSPRLSVVIPLYNCLPLTQAMLTSLRGTLPQDCATEIILVDDGSTDGTRAWLQTLADPAIRVVLNEHNLGYAGANNRGAAVARGEFLALLNNDLVLQPGWLEPMLAAHTALGPAAGLVGNVQRDVRTGTVDHAGQVIGVTGKPEHVRRLPPRLSRWRRPVHIVPAVTGACVLLKRALWQELGGFDEGFINGGEDVDLCLRARAAGKVNAVAFRSVVLHHISASPGRKLRDEQNSYRLARRWRPELLAAADHGARVWCREYLLAALREPRSDEYATALACLAFLLHLRRSRPPAAVLGLERGMAREFARWEAMFGNGAGPRES